MLSNRRSGFSMVLVLLTLSVLILPFALSVHATGFTPSVYSSSGVSSPENAINEDSTYAIINAQGNIIFDLGSAYGNITQIDVKISTSTGTSMLDMWVSKDLVNWFLVSNQFHRSTSGILYWYSFPISYIDCKDIRYVKMMNDDWGYSYLYMDDIHFTDVAKIFLRNNYYYPVMKMASTTDIWECHTGNIGYYLQPSAQYIVPSLPFINDIVDFDIGLRINATSIYINASASNLHVLYSTNYASWWDMGDNTGGNHNYTMYNDEVRYVRVLATSNTAGTKVYNIAVKGIVIGSEYIPPITPPNLFDYTFGSIPIMSLIFIILVPAYIVWKMLSNPIGLAIGGFIGVVAGTYFSVLPTWFLLIMIMGIIAYILLTRNKSIEEG